MGPKVAGRIMFVVGYLLLFSLFSWQAFARELTVFAIQKNLQLANKDPVYHDYYLDGGTEAGLKVGQTVMVVRRIPLHDLTRNRPLGDMHLPVARLKIIYVQRGSSVARVQKLYQDKDRPVVDFNTVMVGDQVSDGTLDGEIEKSDDGESAPAPQAPPSKKEKEMPKGTGDKAEIVPLPEKAAPAAPPAKPAEPVSNAPKT